MRHFDFQQINQLEHLYKIALINSCTGYKSVNLIATKSIAGQTNVAIFSSVTHMGSSPPLIGFICRPLTVMRNTYENIKATGFYTVNMIHEDIITDAHHTSAKYPEGVSEFDYTDLEAEIKLDFSAPFVKGCPVQIGLEYVEEYHIKANDTVLVIGKICHLLVEDELLQPDGFLDLTKGKAATINGLDGYAVPRSNKRLTYQRPKPNQLHQAWLGTRK